MKKLLRFYSMNSWKIMTVVALPWDNWKGESFLSRPCKLSNEWYRRLWEKLYFFRSHLELYNTIISKLTWFCKSTRRKVSESAPTDLSVVSWESNNARKKNLHRWIIQWFTTMVLMSGDPTSNFENQFYTSCYHSFLLCSLITKTMFKGMFKKYISCSVVLTRMLAVVRVCKIALLETRFLPPAPPTKYLGQVSANS